MGAFTCIKTATFQGVKYKPGDVVPEEAIPADRVGAVIRLGLVSELQTEPGQTAPEQPATPASFVVPIKTDGREEQLEVTPEQAVEAIITLQMTAEAAVEHIAGMADDTALHLVYVCDSRKTVKKAASDRAAEIAEAQEATQSVQEAPEGEDVLEPLDGENVAQGGESAAEGAE